MLLLLAVAAVAATSAPSADAQTHAVKCPRGFDSIKHNTAMAVFDIEVLNISCQTAYRDIENFPGIFKSKMRYDGYTCTYKFSGGDGFRFICVAGRRGYAFDAGGD